MTRATDNVGRLQPIDCVITVPQVGELRPRILPDISDTKSALYADEPVIGRSFPVKTYSHSENRNISMKWHVVLMDDEAKQEAITQLNAFRACVYPIEGNAQTPYSPPAICTIDCKQLTAAGNSTQLCVVLRSYSVSFPNDVAWDEDTFLPYRFSIDLNWEVVYASSQLPGRNMIIGG